MGKIKYKKNASRTAGGQAGEMANSGHNAAKERVVESSTRPLKSDDGDTLVVDNVHQSLSYRAIHDKVKTFGRVVRIRLVYDGDSSSRCYITFKDQISARKASEGANDLLTGDSGSKAF